MAVTSVPLSVVVWGFAACTLSFFTPLWLLMKVHPVLSGQAWPHVYVIMWKTAVWTCRSSTQQAATPSRLQPLIWFRVQSILESNPPLTPTFSTGRIHPLNKPNLQCTACLVVHCKKPGDTIQNVWQCIFFFFLTAWCWTLGGNVKCFKWHCDTAWPESVFSHRDYYISIPYWPSMALAQVWCVS